MTEIYLNGVVVIAVGVLFYTLWSGFRTSVLTDFIQVCAMLGAVVVVIPAIFFAMGGPSVFVEGASNLTPQQTSFFSSDAFLNQGAPYIAAVLAYAIGNQTIAQRLFAVREDLIKPTFITATVGYGATIIGIGMLGVVGLYAGINPMEGDLNNLIPQLAGTYFGPVLLSVFFIMIIGSLASTADSDLSALSSIMMADTYGRAGKRKADPRLMLTIGRATMVIATGTALYFAGARMNILDLLVLVGAIWGALVFPVIASFYWEKVTNKAFTVSVLAALAIFFPVRFGWISMDGAVGYVFDAVAVAVARRGPDRLATSSIPLTGDRHDPLLAYRLCPDVARHRRGRAGLHRPRLLPGVAGRASTRRADDLTSEGAAAPFS